MIVSQPDRVLLDRQIVKYSKELKGHLLDVGARDSRYKNYFKVKSYTTLDNNHKHKPDVYASAENIPLPYKSMDSILCSQVLQLVKHPHIAIEECYRVLKKGGKILITVPQDSALTGDTYFRFTKNGITLLLEEAGFKVISIEQRGGYQAVMMQTRIKTWIKRLKPYENWTMLFMCPISLALTHLALFLDKFSYKGFAIGWCVVGEKN